MITEKTHERKYSSTTYINTIYLKTMKCIRTIYCNQYAVQPNAKVLLLPFFCRNQPVCLPLSIVLESLAKKKKMFSFKNQSFASTSRRDIYLATHAFLTLCVCFEVCIFVCVVHAPICSNESIEHLARHSRPIFFRVHSFSKRLTTLH